VPGRVCRTGVALVPEVTETIVAFDDTGRTLTYEADAAQRAVGRSKVANSAGSGKP
jgi:hypothetical protein